MLDATPKFFLATSRFDLGLYEDAREILDEILRETPDHLGARQMRGAVAVELKQPDLALDLLRPLYDAKPDDPELMHLLACALVDTGDKESAIAIWRRGIATEKTTPGMLKVFGIGLYGAGDYETAIRAFERYVEVEPNDHEMVNALGCAYLDLGDLVRAAQCFHRRVDAAPEDVVAITNLGLCYAHQGRMPTAIELLEKALLLAPENGDVLLRLAHCKNAMGDVKSALEHIQNAVEHAPERADLQGMLGMMLSANGDIDSAIDAYERGLDLSPASPQILNNMAMALTAIGRGAEGTERYRGALKMLQPSVTAAAVYSNFMFSRHYDDEVTPETLLAEHRAFGEWVPNDGPATPPHHHANTPDPERRLRVGYVSADFGVHPVGFFVGSVLPRHNPAEIETFCYSNREIEDPITWRIKGSARHWRVIANLTDERVLERIRDDNIDILVDLSGHTAGNRLTVFAKKPAPIQATWAGYVGTTGLEAVDYIIADRYHMPPEIEPFHVERPWRMPHGYICYDPADYAPPVAPLPALANGYVTFGSLNNPSKVGARCLSTWARVVKAVANSKLLLRYRWMESEPNRARIKAAFEAEGVDPERVIILPRTGGAEMLRTYNRIDIGLDSMPYSGGLTTCEAMWMGVPVVTCPGLRFESRHSMSHLSNAGLGEFVTTSIDDYIATAARWADDLDGLARLRQGLRAQMATSPLCDPDRFTRDLDAEYRKMWQLWCARR